MLRNFKSAKGDGGGKGSAAGAGVLLCNVELGSLVGPDGTSAPGTGAATTLVRTTMLVLTWMADLRQDGCGGAFGRAAKSAFASFTATTDRRSPLLLHHFQKNQPEHASVAAA